MPQGGASSSDNTLLFPPSLPSGTPGLPAFDASFDQGFNQGKNNGEKKGAEDGQESTGSAGNREPEGPSFALPGGYGSAAQTVKPGEGDYQRPPVSFSVTLQQGYNDNIYSSSGKRYSVLVSGDGFSYRRAVDPSPLQGSLITQAGLGVQTLFSASRFLLSGNLNGSLLDYWDRKDSPYEPNANSSLLYAYKITPRAQLSGAFTGGYYTQPNLNLVNAPNVGNTGDYFNGTWRSDLSYQWTARISTDTTFNLGTLQYMKSSATPGNYIENTWGQSVRYSLSPRLGVLAEIRKASTSFQTSSRDSATDFYLGGIDFQFTRRFNGSVRAGNATRTYQLPGSVASSLPFTEFSMNYGYGKASSLEWTGRYGFEEGINTSSNSTKTFRTSVGVTQVFSPKLSASTSLGYSHSEQAQILASSAAPAAATESFTYSLSAQYMLSRTLSVFGNWNHSQVFNIQPAGYSTNTTFLGITYHF
jgi:hypothetical protein